MLGALGALTPENKIKRCHFVIARGGQVEDAQVGGGGRWWAVVGGGGRWWAVVGGGRRWAEVCEGGRWGA